jgi:hypothetical protein
MLPLTREPYQKLLIVTRLADQAAQVSRYGKPEM